MVLTLQVGIRVRPQNHAKPEDVSVCPIPYRKQVIIGNVAAFSADYVFPIDCNQSLLYECSASNLINSFIEGHDVNIIALGKQSSGKTYSLFGSTHTFASCRNPSVHDGVIPRAVRHIYTSLSKLQQACPSIQCGIVISHYGINKGEVFDFLSTCDGPKVYSLTVNEKGLTVIDGVAKQFCLNIDKAFDCLELGLQPHKYNWTTNNFSALFFTITLRTQWIEGGELKRNVSSCTFIELGSSSSVPCAYPNGPFYPQNSNNNSGLRALSNVISMLQEDRLFISPQFSSDFLLSTFLKDAFTISSYTLLVCCLTSGSRDNIETTNYLRAVQQLQSIFCNRLLVDKTYEINTAGVTRETACDNSDNEYTNKTDSFGLEFAASQWEKLVTNAETLFNQLVKNGFSKETQEQIEQWLFLKQECEDCLTNGSSHGLHGKETHSLERIDEVTESEGDSSNRSRTESEAFSESLDELEELQAAKTRQDLFDKVENFIESLRLKTDKEIDKYIDKNLKKQQFSRSVSPPKTNVWNSSKSGRRKSILSFDGPMKLDVPLPVGESVSEDVSLSHSGKTPSKTKSLDKVVKYDKEPGVQKHTMLSDKSTEYCDISLRNQLEKHNMQLIRSESKLQEQITGRNLSGESVKKVSEKDKRQSKRKVHGKFMTHMKKEEENKHDLNKDSLEDQRWIKEQDSNKLQSIKSSCSTEGNSHIPLGFQRSSDSSVSHEALRMEIVKLRCTRDLLIEKRKQLDSKLNKEKVFTAAEERKYLECDEAIEAVDSTIEYKNGVLCGQKDIIANRECREKGDKMLVDRLMNLSEPEMRSLLFRYFQKIVDLRESGRRMEQQLAEQDQHIETQAWKIQALSNALQQANIENERRLVMVHREHQEKLHLMFRHYGNSDGSSVDREGNSLHSQNKALKHRVLELEAMLYASKGQLQRKDQPSSSNVVSIPHQNLKKLQGASTARTTKVTRQKNKLIIQQQTTKKQK